MYFKNNTSLLRVIKTLNFIQHLLKLVFTFGIPEKMIKHVLLI